MTKSETKTLGIKTACADGSHPRVPTFITKYVTTEKSHGLLSSQLAHLKLG